MPPPYTDIVLPEKNAYALNEHQNESLNGLCRSFSEFAVTEVLGPEVLCWISWQRNFVLFEELTLVGYLPASVDDFAVAASMMHRAGYQLLGFAFPASVDSHAGHHTAIADYKISLLSLVCLQERYW